MLGNYPWTVPFASLILPDGRVGRAGVFFLLMFQIWGGWVTCNNNHQFPGLVTVLNVQHESIQVPLTKDTQPPPGEIPILPFPGCVALGKFSSPLWFSFISLQAWPEVGGGHEGWGPPSSWILIPNSSSDYVKVQ